MQHKSIDLKTSFQIIASKDKVQGDLLTMCELLYEKGTSTTRVDVISVLEELQIKSLSNYKADALKILILYIRLALNDNILCNEEKNNIKFLKLLFGIKDGDFKDNKSIFTQVKNIINIQLQLIYLDDDNIDNSEALHKVDLQEVFGLSYDDFLNITNHFDLLIIGKSLDKETKTLKESEDFYSEAVRKIDSFIDSKTLDDWMKKRFELSESDKRMMDEIMEKHGFSYDEEDDKPKRSRRISQSVKDKVWNRDGGKCVLCGSNENIEFDHIVPFSKGGANTYRNIQILCESCNRKKSDNIGLEEDYFESDYNLDDDSWLDSI
tara:strand:+ start:33 stop:998 length:966 start_codon:yes stop_codon:yes gene_type:complete